MLADAHTQGTTGPNLDDAFASDKTQGFSLQTMADVVRGQIAYPEPPMPPTLVQGNDADDVSVYIAKCAANPNCGVTAARPAPAPTTTTSLRSGGSCDSSLLGCHHSHHHGMPLKSLWKTLSAMALPSPVMPSVVEAPLLGDAGRGSKEKAQPVR